MKLRPGVTFHDGEKLDAAAVKFNIERHKTMPGSNRRGELAPVTSVDVVDPMTVRLNLSAPFSPLLAAARRPRRHDGLAQGGAGRGRQVRRQPGVLGAVQVRRARRAGPHRARALSQLLEQGRDPFRQDHLPADRRLDGAPRQPAVRPARLHRAHGAVRRAGAQERQPLQDLEDHRDRLPGHHDQRRQERSGAEESARPGPARARGVRAVARPRGHRAGRDGRRGGRSATSGWRRPTRTTRRTCRSRSATSPGRRRCCRRPACPTRRSR